MPTDVTTVPAALTALVALGRTTLPNGSVTVYDGAPDTDNLPSAYLSVGWSRDEEEASVEGQATDEGNRVGSETYSVHHILSVAIGDNDPTAVASCRSTCAYLFGLFATGLRADPTLGGVLTAGAAATLGSFSWIYGPSSDGGTYAEVEFDVDVAAYYLGAA